MHYAMFGYMSYAYDIKNKSDVSNCETFDYTNIFCILSV